MKPSSLLRGTDWLAWHGHYDDPDSRFSRRLALLQGRLRSVLDRAAPLRRRSDRRLGQGPGRSNTRARIQSLFQRAGFVEIDAEDVEDPALHAGVERFAGVPVALEPGRRLFTFRDPRVPRTSRMLRYLRRARGVLRR